MFSVILAGSGAALLGIIPTGESGSCQPSTVRPERSSYRVCGIRCVGGLWLCRGFKRFETNLLTGNLFQHLWTHQKNPAFIMSGTEGGDNDESVLTWNNLQTPSSCRYKHFLCSLSQFCLGELVLYLHSKLVIMWCACHAPASRGYQRCTKGACPTRIITINIKTDSWCFKKMKPVTSLQTSVVHNCVPPRILFPLIGRVWEWRRGRVKTPVAHSNHQLCTQRVLASTLTSLCHADCLHFRLFCVPSLAVLLHEGQARRFWFLCSRDQERNNQNKSYKWFIRV